MLTQRDRLEASQCIESTVSSARQCNHKDFVHIQCVGGRSCLSALSLFPIPPFHQGGNFPDDSDWPRAIDRFCGVVVAQEGLMEGMLMRDGTVTVIFGK